VALKWGEVAADEAAFNSALHARWKRDLELGRMPNRIMENEVPRFSMPEGWSSDDLIYTGAKRQP